MWWTLLSAGLGAATALLIAFVAYPYQKNKDRNLELQREKRSLYQRLLSDLSSMDDMTWGYEPIPDGYGSKLREVALRLHLYAPEEVIDAVHIELDARLDLMTFFRDSVDGGFADKDVGELADIFFGAQARLMRLLRYDLTGEHIDTSKMKNPYAVLAFDHKITIEKP